ncbi:hypothetical protein [Psychrobacter immobilis]|uniref:YobI family P-loop NTPase n=1 Tax=Psychrobacter immobilis TaxID=498 RepID=UPI001917E1A3|nr:hypothetical protein [Psychrobacter immobilis]
MEGTILNHKISIEKVSNLDMEHDLEVHSLAPTDNLDEGINKDRYIEYEKRLVSALKRPNITNIAITGTYGSGKSSVLNTFKRRSKNANNYKFLDISLSTFQINGGVEEYNDKDSENFKATNSLEPEQIQLIERSILQQFFYAVPQDEIPLSRFKRITSESRFLKFFYIINIILLLGSSLVVFDKTELIEAIYPIPLWLPKISIWIFIACLLIIIYKIVNTAFELSEIKLNFHDSEFNIKNDKEKSILNDHLDEILYFFDATKSNVVVIEDLDRFDNNEIFIRLRELNLIVNKYCKHKVVFIYAIKDNMFKDKERTKFFEYILPIIPIINPSNSFNWIQENYRIIASKLDRKFLRNICFYFDDLRLVKNIFNEYELYRDNLKELHLDENTLFSMVVYKNKYPNDFSELHINKGEVYNAFNTYKSKLILKNIEKLSSKLDEINEDIDALKSENINNIDELNSIYSGIILSYISKEVEGKNVHNLFTIFSGNKKFEIYEINTPTFFDSLMQESDLQYQFHQLHQGSRRESIDFKEIEKTVDSRHTYEQRLAIITSRKNGEVKKLYDKREKLSIERKSIEMRKLSAFEKHGGLLEDKPLLRFLVINGYIDENYYKYISYFSDSDITLDEQNYLIQVFEQRDPSFDTNITNHDIILREYIGVQNLLLSSSLNFYILDYLLNNQFLTLQLKSLLDNITNASYHSFEFMSQYLQRGRNLVLFIPLLIATREDVIEDLQIGFENEDSYYNLTKIISHLPLDQLKDSNYLTSKLKKLLEDHSEYIEFVLKCFDEDESKFKQFSDILKPNIKNISYAPSKSELINWLGSNNYLSININLIKNVIDSIYPLPDASVHETMYSELKDQPFTFLSSLEETYFPIHLWSENLPLYVGEFLNSLENGKLLTESEDIFIRLLNSEYMKSDHIDTMMQIVSTKILDIRKVDVGLYDELFEYNIANANWSNINIYFHYCENKIVDNLISFINLNFKCLSNQCTQFKSLTSDIHGNEDSIEIALIECNRLEDSAYESILNTSDNEWLNINISKLSKNKVLFLISNNLFGLNTNNWQSILDCKDNEIRSSYIEHHIISVTNGKLIEELESDDFSTIISSDRISKEQKQRFISQHISTITTVLDIANKDIIKIFDDNPLSDKLYDYFIKNLKPEDIRLLLLVQNNNLNDDDVLSLISKMGEPFNQLSDDDNSKTKFEITSKNKDILEILHHKGIIINFDDDKKTKKNKYYETRLRKGLSI